MENATDQYLDDIILSQAGHRQLKVAMLHIRVWDACKAEERIVSNEKFNERLRQLVTGVTSEHSGTSQIGSSAKSSETQETTNRKPAG
jgi:hypothetical protein